MEYFADLHVHIGEAKGQPVKITASRKLTLANIIDTCLNKKGIGIVGIVDCASPYVLMEIEEHLLSGKIYELPSGGLSYNDQLTIIMGAEIETGEARGAAHSIAYFPYVEQMRDFSKIMSEHITNITLSSQKARLNAKQLFKIVKKLGGKLIPAHVFTPFKSFYGSCYDRLNEGFGSDLKEISAIELGLSADTYFADTIMELSDKSFLSNSDAHSLSKIGREYNKFKLKKPDFESIFSALKRKQGENSLKANYGLKPELGKYHRTFCEDCGFIAEESPPVLTCNRCQSKNITLGVLDRINSICDYKEPQHPAFRPPYQYQIPLEFIPGVGKKTIERLISNFDSEMNVIHNTDLEQLTNVVGEKIAKRIVKARQGTLRLMAGGGGFYGKVL